MINIVLNPSYQFNDLINATNIRLFNNNVLVNTLPTTNSINGDTITVIGSIVIPDISLTWFYNKIEIRNSSSVMATIVLDNYIQLFHIKKYSLKLIMTNKLILSEIDLVIYEIRPELGSSIINDGIQVDELQSFSSKLISDNLDNIPEEHFITNNFIDVFRNKDRYMITNGKLVGQRVSWELTKVPLTIVKVLANLEFDPVSNVFINYSIIGTTLRVRTLPSAEIVNFNSATSVDYDLQVDTFLELSTNYFITNNRYVFNGNEGIPYMNPVKLFNNSGTLVVVDNSEVELIDMIKTSKFQDLVQLYKYKNLSGYTIKDIKYNMIIMEDEKYYKILTKYDIFTFLKTITYKVISVDLIIIGSNFYDLRKSIIYPVTYTYQDPFIRNLSKNPSKLSGTITNPVWIGNHLYSKNSNTYTLI